jgi:hypothetical protein
MACPRPGEGWSPGTDRLTTRMTCPRSGLPGPSIVGAMACPLPGEGWSPWWLVDEPSTTTLHPPPPHYQLEEQTQSYNWQDNKH